MPGNVLIMPRNASITVSAMLTPKWFLRHAANAEGLSIETSFTGQIFDDLKRIVSYFYDHIHETTLTSFFSSSPAGTGHTPGSSVIALKKLYAHKIKRTAKRRLAVAYPGVSVERPMSKWHDKRKRDVLYTILVNQAHPNQTIVARIIPAQ
jgi:hypothetical protein